MTAIAAPQLAGRGEGLVAVGRSDGFVSIYRCRAHDGALEFVGRLAGHALKVTALAFSDAGVLASGSLDCSVVVWRRQQAASGGCDAAAPADQQQDSRTAGTHTHTADQQQQEERAGAFHAEGQRIVFDEPVTALALTPCGQTLVVAHGCRTSFWDLSAPGRAQRVGTFWDWPSPPRALALMPDGSMHFVAVGR
jgi:hypothetical protein